MGGRSDAACRHLTNLKLKDSYFFFLFIKSVSYECTLDGRGKLDGARRIKVRTGSNYIPYKSRRITDDGEGKEGSDRPSPFFLSFVLFFPSWGCAPVYSSVASRDLFLYA